MEALESYLITNGPSKFDLMAGLFVNKIVKITLVNLETGKGDEVEVSIISIEKSRSKDLLGRGWKIKMVAVTPQDKIKRSDKSSIKKDDGFDGWYDSTTRKGNTCDWYY